MPINQYSYTDKVAEFWYRTTASRSNPEAYFKLGTVYEENKDRQMAMKAYLDGAIHRNENSFLALQQLTASESHASYYLGVVYENRGLWSEALNAYLSADITPAHYRIGVLYRKDRMDGTRVVIKKDLDQELSWYRKAASEYSSSALNGLFELARTQAKAMFTLGVMFENGEGIKKDSVKALEYYVKSDRAGGMEAPFRLAQMENDLVKSYHLYMVAHSKNHPQAINMIEPLLDQMDDKQLNALPISQHVAAQRGKRAALGNVEAFTLLCRTASSDQYSAYIVAGMYENGNAVPLNLDQALSYYLIAARKGHANSIERLKSLAEGGELKAQYTLGAEYYISIRNTLEAARWCMKAAEQEHPQAQNFMKVTSFSGKDLFEIASIYEKGEWVKQNIVHAFEFYLKSGRAGHKEGIFRAAQLHPLLPKQQRETSPSEWDLYCDALNRGESKALFALERLAQYGTSQQQMKMVDIYTQRRNPTKEIYWLEKAKESGDTTANGRLTTLGGGSSTATQKIVIHSRAPKPQNRTCVSANSLQVVNGVSI